MMISYQVRKGDTIAQVTKQLNTDWQTLKKQNPDAIGRLKRNGNWFLREGATVNIEGSFASSLQNAVQEQSTSAVAAVSAPPKTPLMVLPFLDDLETESATDSEETAGSEQVLLDADSNIAVVNSSEDSSEDSSEQVIEHTLQPGETVWQLALKKYHVNVDDIMEANNIDDPTKLQIGQTLRIPLPEKGAVEQVVASWYGEDFHGKTMANGQIFDMNGATIAHKEIPLGTRVALTNTETGETVEATVADRGPYIKGRDVDLSYGVAKQLSLLESGVGTLEMRIL